MNRDQLLKDLAKDEGFKPYLYDDFNGRPITKGSKVIGNPTIAFGWSVSTEPCTEELGNYILGYFADDSWNDLVKALPWVLDLPESVQRALANMSYNLGVKSLTHFYTFLNYLQQKKFSEAADDLKTTLWAKQVGPRATRIEELIRHA
jgi:lysozyme